MEDIFAYWVPVCRLGEIGRVVFVASNTIFHRLVRMSRGFEILSAAGADPTRQVGNALEFPSVRSNTCGGSHD